MAGTALISATALARTLEDPGTAPRVVDCRFSLAEPEAGERAWRRRTIPGASYAHLDRDLSGPVELGGGGRHPLPTPERAAERFAALGIDGSRPVVAFDASGGPFAARLWWMLRWMGFDEVQVLDGGWSAWLEGGHPTEPGQVPGAATQSWPARVRPEMAIDVATLGAAREGLALVDARAPVRYRGEEEPIDAEAGHIPGAVNRPWTENLGADGHMRPPEELRARFADLFASHAPQEIVVYCGSGVTACHDLLAMHCAGLLGATLYPGSWSGWISDPSRPRARGA